MYNHFAWRSVCEGPTDQIIPIFGLANRYLKPLRQRSWWRKMKDLNLRGFSPLQFSKLLQSTGLCQSSVNLLLKQIWSVWRESNSWHPAPKAGALPAALHTGETGRRGEIRTRARSLLYSFQDCCFQPSSATLLFKTLILVRRDGYNPSQPGAPDLQSGSRS